MSNTADNAPWENSEQLQPVSTNGASKSAGDCEGGREFPFRTACSFGARKRTCMYEVSSHLPYESDIYHASIMGVMDVMESTILTMC